MINLNIFPASLRFRCGSGKLQLCRYFTIFAIFKNLEHSVEPGETPSYSKLCSTFLNIAKYFKAVRCGCDSVAVIFQFTYVQYCRNTKHSKGKDSDSRPFMFHANDMAKQNVKSDICRPCCLILNLQ